MKRMDKIYCSNDICHMANLVNNEGQDSKYAIGGRWVVTHKRTPIAPRSHNSVMTSQVM